MTREMPIRRAIRTRERPPLFGRGRGGWGQAAHRVNAGSMRRWIFAASWAICMDPPGDAAGPVPSRLHCDRDFGPFYGFVKAAPAAATLIVRDLLARA
jgi:hypothetical protein